MAAVTVRLDLGPAALFEDLAAFLADLNAVCRFGSELQRVADRNVAIYEVLTGRPDFLPDPEDLFLWRFGRSRLFGWPGTGVPVPSVERAIEEQLVQSEADARADVRVVHLSYENPVEVVILVSGGVILAVLRMVRDWPARRRLNDTIAADYASRVRARSALRREVIRQVASGQTRLSPEQVTELLSADVETAMLALGDVPISIEGLDQDGNAN